MQAAYHLKDLFVGGGNQHSAVCIKRVQHRVQVLVDAIIIKRWCFHDKRNGNWLCKEPTACSQILIIADSS